MSSMTFLLALVAITGTYGDFVPAGNTPPTFPCDMNQLALMATTFMDTVSNGFEKMYDCAQDPILNFFTENEEEFKKAMVGVEPCFEDIMNEVPEDLDGANDAFEKLWKCGFHNLYPTFASHPQMFDKIQNELHSCAKEAYGHELDIYVNMASEAMKAF